MGLGVAGYQGYHVLHPQHLRLGHSRPWTSLTPQGLGPWKDQAHSPGALSNRKAAPPGERSRLRRSPRSHFSPKRPAVRCLGTWAGRQVTEGGLWAPYPHVDELHPKEHEALQKNCFRKERRKKHTLKSCAVGSAKTLRRGCYISWQECATPLGHIQRPPTRNRIATCKEPAARERFA